MTSTTERRKKNQFTLNCLIKKALNKSFIYFFEDCAISSYKTASLSRLTHSLRCFYSM